MWQGFESALGKVLAQSAWMETARRNSRTIEADDVHKALRQVPAATLNDPLNPVLAVPGAIPGFSRSPLFSAPRPPI